MKNALAQAKEGRMHILGIMNETISEPRKELSPYAPVIDSLQIKVDQIGALIGPGGKVIQKIQKDYGVDITVEEDGKVSIAAPRADAAREAKSYIKSILAEPEIGAVYQGTVKRVMEYGAFVEIIPGKEGLLHVSNLDWKRVENVGDYLKEGDKVEVKLIKIEHGKMSLSRKALLERPPKEEKK